MDNWVPMVLGMEIPVKIKLPSGYLPILEMGGYITGQYYPMGAYANFKLSVVDGDGRPVDVVLPKLESTLTPDAAGGDSPFFSAGKTRVPGFDFEENGLARIMVGPSGPMSGQVTEAGNLTVAVDLWLCLRRVWG